MNEYLKNVVSKTNPLYTTISCELCEQNFYGIFITCIDCNISETAITKSPGFTIPLAFNRTNVRLKLLSMSSLKSSRNGIRPHCKFKHLLTCVEGVNANIGQSGRQRDRRDAMSPFLVYTNIASTARLFAIIKSPNIIGLVLFSLPSKLRAT